MEDKEVSKYAKSYALRNAIEYGKADSGKILPKLFQHGLGKNEIKKVMPLISKEVKEVNAMSVADRKKLYGLFKKNVVAPQKKREGLPELDNVGKRPVFRIAPYPNGALHIGHAKAFLINALYAEKYGGRIVLMMDDTIGSEKKQVELDAYDLIKNDLDWLKVNYGKKIYYKSDRLSLYYSYALKLIKKEKAYVCHCSQANFKKLKDAGKECACRQFPSAEQKKRWKAMFSAKEGSQVLRIKTDMQHPNPAFRDRVLFKISDRKHARVEEKYRVWPTLEMSWAVDDHELKITHIIRGSDLRMETDMERYIWNVLGVKSPEIYHTGIARITGAKVSKSKSSEEVKSGEYIGWSDPRTWSIQSLHRRGINQKAVREFVKEIGLNKQDTTVPIDNLYAINRRIVDAKADRYSFLEKHVEIKVEKRPEYKSITVPYHPDKPDKKRVVDVSKIFISKKDYLENLGNEVRLIGLYNITLKKGNKGEFTGEENKQIKKINWVGSHVPGRILTVDGKWINGLVDSGVSELNPGQVIQFERLAFCSFDRIVKEKGKTVYEFWLTHR